MVEGKLRKLSQVSSAFITAINTVISKLTTADYTVQQGTFASSPALIIVNSDALVEPYVVIKPSTDLLSGSLDVVGDNSATVGIGLHAEPSAAAELYTYGENLSLKAGAKQFLLNATTGSLTLPGYLRNTAIADLSAAAGQLWLSSTNVDNLKYSSATTLYTVHSTKGATATNTAAAPTATASATAVMMACGGAITPANTGRVHITISGQMANDTINDGVTVDLRYGTGTAPINGAAVTGTLVGVAQTATSLVAAAKSGFCISGVVTGLTLGTAIWIDAALNRVTGGNASITGVTISAFEV